jgi:hypothetical protein
MDFVLTLIVFVCMQTGMQNTYSPVALWPKIPNEINADEDTGLRSARAKEGV